MKIEHININLITPNEKQPRKIFEKNELRELAESIKRNGIVQPIIVRKKEIGYEIIAGERRWRASKIIKLKKIPAIVRSVEKNQQIEISIIENIQRENLNPIEEALSFKSYLDGAGETQERLGKIIGKSRSYVSNTMRLLKLPDEVIKLTLERKLSSGHSRALLSVLDIQDQLDLAKKVVAEGISVRQLETMVKQTKRKDNKKSKKDIFLKELEEKLTLKLCSKVTIFQNKKKGKIEIEYYSQEELEKIIEVLS